MTYYVADIVVVVVYIMNRVVFGCLQWPLVIYVSLVYQRYNRNLVSFIQSFACISLLDSKVCPKGEPFYI